MANEKGQPFADAAAADEPHWLRDGPPALLQQLRDMLGPLLGPRQHRLRGLVQHMAISQAFRFLIKILILDPAARSLQIGALRRQVIHRRLLPVLDGTDVGAIEEVRVIQTLPQNKHRFRYETKRPA